MYHLPQHEVALAGLVVLASIIARILWNLKLSPLARQHIPGPALAVASEIWYHARGAITMLHRTMPFNKVYFLTSATFGGGPMDDLVQRLDRDGGIAAGINALHLMHVNTIDMLGIALFDRTFNQVKSGCDSPLVKNMSDWLLDLISFAAKIYDETAAEPTDLNKINVIGSHIVTLPPAKPLLNKRSSRTWEFFFLPVMGSYVIDTLRGLPYLNAFAKEILRAHSPAGHLLERVVPAGGMSLEGYCLPAGTTVGASAYASGRREDLFPDAAHISPERWVEKTADGAWVDRHNVPLEQMNATWHPFNIGIRACVGRPLAEIEILLTLAAVVGHFRLELHEDTTQESMRLALSSFYAASADNTSQAN
ncbi:cytochrome P450 [Auriculariales sp. MPI-PUGE-AT-0066]|nr:cytochrome P450 [Auriculariales sp. MPI-PUGE-AT-0066]